MLLKLIETRLRLLQVHAFVADTDVADVVDVADITARR